MLWDKSSHHHPHNFFRTTNYIPDIAMYLFWCLGSKLSKANWTCFRDFHVTKTGLVKLLWTLSDWRSQKQVHLTCASCTYLNVLLKTSLWTLPKPFVLNCSTLSWLFTCSLLQFLGQLSQTMSYFNLVDQKQRHQMSKNLKTIFLFEHIYVSSLWLGSVFCKNKTMSSTCRLI